MHFYKISWNAPSKYLLSSTAASISYSYCLFSTQKTKAKINNSYNAFWVKALLGFSFSLKSLQCLLRSSLTCFTSWPSPLLLPICHTTPGTRFRNSLISRHCMLAASTQMPPSLWGQPLPSYLKLKSTCPKFLTNPSPAQFFPWRLSFNIQDLSGKSPATVNITVCTTSM